MPEWLEDASANRHIKTYVKDFLDVSGNMYVRSNADYAWNVYGQVISGVYESDNNVYSGGSIGSDVSGLTIVVNANRQDGAGSGTNDGAVTVYRYDTTAEIWYQLGNIITGETTQSEFGIGVAINDAGTRIMATDNTDNFVNVYDYNSSTNTWDKQVSITADGVGGFAGSISGDGNTIVFGDFQNNSYTGKQYVYRNTSGTTWTKIGEFTGSHTEAYAGLDPSISYDGNRITFCEKDYNFDADGNSVSNLGRIAIYDYSGSGTTWNQVGDHIYGENAEDRSSGVSDLSKDGSIVAVGASYSHYIRVYQYDASVDGSWKQLGTTILGPTDNNYGAGVRLSDDGTVLLVNDNGDVTGATNDGALYIYKYINGDWVQQGSTIYGIYTGSGTYPGGNLGASYSGGIAISGDGTKIFAGGNGADLNGTKSGYVQAWQWSAKSYGPLIDISGETVIFGKDMHKDDPNYYKVVQDGMDTSSYGVNNVLYGQGYYDYFGAALAMNADGTRMIVGANKASYNATEDGYAIIFKWQNGRWGQMGKPISQSNSYHRIGNTVDMNDTGNMIVLGKQYGSSNNASGAIEAYEFINGDWAKRGSTIDGSTSSAYFGFEACAMDGTGNVIAGMDIIGKVRVYQYVEGNSDWSQLGSDISISSGQANSNNEATKRIDLSQDGTIIVIGDVFDDTTGTNNGRLSVYKFTGDVTDGSWNLIGNHITITTSDSFPQDDRLGQEVSINSDGTIVAGTSIYYNSEEGRTFIFKYSEEGGVWAQLGTDIGSDQMPDDEPTYNARSVALSGDGKTVTIGHSHEDTTGTNAGSVSVFKYVDGNWTRIGTIYGRQSYGYLRFSCISRDGTRFAAGTRSTDDIDTESGSVMTARIVNYLDGAAMKIEHDRVHIPKLEIGNEWTTDLKNIYDGILSTPMMTLTGLSSHERDFRKEWGLDAADGFATDLWGFTEKVGYENATYLYVDNNQYYQHDLILRGAKRGNNTNDNFSREGYMLLTRYLRSYMYIQTYSDTDTTFGTLPNKRLSLGIGNLPGPYGLIVNGNANASTSWNSSDDRLKHNEELITNGLETIRKLAPRHYYKTRKIYDADHNFDLDASGNPLDASGNALPITEYDIETGFIAQEVKEISELAHTFQKGIDDDQPHGLQYSSIFVRAIKALQELDEKVQQRQAIITSLEEKIQVLENA